MTNREIYGKTLGLSIRRLLLNMFCLLLIFGLPVVIYLITRSEEKTMLIATSTTFIISCVVAGLISHFIGHMLKAGQVAMMAEGVAYGEMPANVYEGAKNAVKKRFVTVSAFYVIERLVSGITHQVTNGISSLTNAIAGSDNDTAKGIAAVINLIIAIVMHYVIACSMAWVFIHPDENAFKLVCDGAVVYFQNWKALLKNVGLVLLISILSLAIIGGSLTVGIHSLVNNRAGVDEMVTEMTAAANKVLAETAKDGEDPTQLDPETMLWILCIVLGLAVWAVLHNTLVEPYVQVCVLSIYIRAAQENPPKLDIYGKLCNVSKKFKSAFERSAEPKTV